MPSILGLLLCLGLAFGCSLDVNTRKHKFIQEADGYFRQGKYPEARLIYGRALQLDPSFAAAHYGSARCDLQLANWLAASQELRRTIDLEPNNWPAQLDLGKLLLAGGQAREARDRAVITLQGDSRNVDAQLLLANADAQLGNLEVAIEEAKKATELAPDRATPYLVLGLIQAADKALPEAEANLRAAKQRDPSSSVIALSLGRFYAGLQRWVEAESEYRSSINLAPKDPAPRATLAALYIAEGKNTLAEEILKNAQRELKDNPSAYRMLADYYFIQGDRARALTEFAALSREHPDDLRVHKSYAQLLILAGQMDEATKMTDEILEKSPQDDEGLVLKGQILLHAGKTDDALHTLEQAMKSNPANAFGHFQLGMALLAKGNAHQAESEWRAATKMRPDLTDPWVALGKSAIDRRDWVDLELIGAQLTKIAPRSAGGYLFHATARMNRGDTAGAEVDLKQLIQVSPESPTGYAKLAQLRAISKNWREAEALYREALNRSPNSIEAIQGVVELDFQRGKPADALRFIQEKINANPNDAALYLLQGHALVRLKQPADAKQSLSRCIELDKQNLSGVIMLAQVEQSLGDVPGTIAHYRKAISLAPNNAWLYTTLGTLYEGQGDWQEAQTLYQRALAIQPEEPRAANNLAYLLLEHGGNVTVALTLAQTARRSFPNLPNSADTLGWAYYQNAAYSLAAPLLEEAVKGAPFKATYRYHLGLTYQKLNDTQKARIELEKSIRMDPAAPSAEKASRTLTELAGS